MEDKVIIDEEFIQEEAEQEIGRKLTAEELDTVIMAMWDGYNNNTPIWQMVREAIWLSVEKEPEVK